MTGIEFCTAAPLQPDFSHGCSYSAPSGEIPLYMVLDLTLSPFFVTILAQNRMDNIFLPFFMIPTCRFFIPQSRTADHSVLNTPFVHIIHFRTGASTCARSLFPVDTNLRALRYTILVSMTQDQLQEQTDESMTTDLKAAKGDHLYDVRTL